MLAAVQAKRRCATPERHATFQKPMTWGNLAVAESLDEADIVRFTTCGLCQGILTIEPYHGGN